MPSTVSAKFCCFPLFGILLLGVVRGAFSVTYLPAGGILNCFACNGTRCASVTGIRAEPCPAHAGYDGEPVRCLTFKGLMYVVGGRISYTTGNGAQRMCSTRGFMEEYFGDFRETGSKTTLLRVTTGGGKTFWCGEMHYCSGNACNNGPDVIDVDVPVNSAARSVGIRKRQGIRCRVSNDPTCSSTHFYTCPNIPGDEFDSTPIRCMKFTGTLIQETPSGMVIYAINTTQRSCATRGFVRSFGATVYRNNCQNVTNFRIRNKDITEHWTGKMCFYSDDSRAYNTGNILNTSFLVFALAAFLSHVSSSF